jgi:hypothetical protein
MRNGSGNWVQGEAYGSATKFNDGRLKTKSRRPLQNQLQ